MAFAYDSVTAISRDNFVKRLTDNIFKENPSWEELEKRKDFEDGGPNIIEPIIYATGTSESYSGYDVLDTTAEEEFTAASFQRRFYHRAVVISREDELKNSGSNQQVISLVQAKWKNAEISLRDKFGTDLYVDGGGTAIDGLADVVSATSTYGGIAVADFAGWAASVGTIVGNYGLSDISDKIEDLTIGTDRPELILMTHNGYRRLRDLAQAQQRFNVDREESIAWIGFRGVRFEGIPCIADQKVPSGEICFLNFKWFHWRPNRDENFRFEPFVKPTNQNVHVGHIYSAGNITTSQRRMQGKLTGITE